MAVVADLAGLEDQGDNIVDAGAVVTTATAIAQRGWQALVETQLLVRTEAPHEPRLIARRARRGRDVLRRRLCEIDVRVEDEAELVAAVHAEVLLPGDTQPGPSPRGRHRDYG